MHSFIQALNCYVCTVSGVTHPYTASRYSMTSYPVPVALVGAWSSSSKGRLGARWRQQDKEWLEEETANASANFQPWPNSNSRTNHSSQCWVICHFKRALFSHKMTSILCWNVKWLFVRFTFCQHNRVTLDTQWQNERMFVECIRHTTEHDSKWMNERKKIYIARLKAYKCMLNLPRLAEN